MIAALRFEVNENYNALIYPAGSFNDVDWGTGQSCSLGNEFLSYKFKKPKDSTVGITIATGADGTDVIRFTETKRYTIKINSKSGTGNALPFLQNEGNKSLKLDKDENTVVFQFVNYLGRSKITFPDR